MPPGTLGEFEQQVLLAVWHLGDDAYGVSIRDELEERAGRVVAHGAVYATLVRLEKKGLVASRLADPTPVRGGKAKRYFAITAEGQDAVGEARRTMNRLWDGLPEPSENEG